jgi:hypothetical protein
VGAIELKDTADQMAIDRRMKEHGRCNNQPSRSIENHTTEIARFPYDRRVTGTIEMIMHFFDQARDLVADDLNGDRIHDQVVVRTRLR